MQSQQKPRFDGDDPTWAIAATAPGHPDSLTDPSRTMPRDAAHAHEELARFVPTAPGSFDEAGTPDTQIESLILKFLLNCGCASGREIAEQVALPFGITEPLLHRLKAEQLVVFKSSAPFSDYVYELTASGGERARRYLRQSSYFGAAPVPLDAYVQSVTDQSVRRHKVKPHDVQRAFADLVLDDRMLSQLGEGINAGLGFFLYGEPGNGKTSIAERVTTAFGEGIWIPRAINAGGEIIRLFDPTAHEILVHEGQQENGDSPQIDRRWVYIRRPTIVVGGELKLENLEVTTNPVTGINEAPLQLKANGGTLVVDDFGRQRFRPDELMNRLIVPLERRIDFLNLPSGRTFRVPFDVLSVFSTNLDPLSMVDEAFLRRIPYKIDVNDPTEQQFRDVFQEVARRMGIACSVEALDYLVQRHYRESKRALRFCHPRDLLEQVYNACEFREQPLAVSHENLDTAVHNYLMLQAHAGGSSPPRPVSS